MKRRMLVTLAIASGWTAWLVSPLWSDDKVQGGKGTLPEWMTTGPEHAKLAARAGTYDVVLRTWESTDAPVAETQGQARFRTILDKRFLEQTFEGEWQGRRFNGLEILGFDRAANKYTAYWADSLGTGSIFLTGASMDGGKTVEMRGSMFDPQTQRTVNMRMVVTEASPSEFTVEMYCDKGGEEGKTMEIRYTKRS